MSFSLSKWSEGGRVSYDNPMTDRSQGVVLRDLFILDERLPACMYAYHVST